MAGHFASIDGLNPKQREAVRLDVTGALAKDIAATIGVNPATISQWRALPLYQEAMEALYTEMDRDTIREARRVRGAAMRVMVNGLERMAEFTEMSPQEAASTTKAALDVYRALSAQTGITEESAVKHSLAIDPRDALREMVEAIRDRRA